MQLIAKLIHNFKLMKFRKDRPEFYQELAKSVESKEQLRDFLAEELRIAVAPKTRNDSRAYALRIMARKQAIAEQNRYSVLLGSVMPANDRLMLTALDDAPDKPALLRTLSQAIISQREIIGIVRGKVIPPLLMLPGVFIFCYILATKSIPIIVQIAPPEVWTTFNTSVRLSAEFFANHGGKALLVSAALIAAFMYQLPRWVGTWRTRAESVSPRVATLVFPVFPFLLPLGIYRDLQVGLMFSSLAVMLQAGRTLTEALQTVRGASQPWMKWHLRRVLSHLEMYPTEYTKSFSKGLMSPQLLARLASQIRTNPRFDEVLIKIGTQGGDDIAKEVCRQSTIINAQLMIGGAALFMYMMIGQLSISQSLSEEMSPAAMMKKRVMKLQPQARAPAAISVDSVIASTAHTGSAAISHRLPSRPVG